MNKKLNLNFLITQIMIATAEKNLSRVSHLDMQLEQLLDLTQELVPQFELDVDNIRQSCVYAMKVGEDYNKWFRDAQKKYQMLK